MIKINCILGDLNKQNPIQKTPLDTFTVLCARNIFTYSVKSMGVMMVIVGQLEERQCKSHALVNSNVALLYIKAFSSFIQSTNSEKQMQYVCCTCYVSEKGHLHDMESMVKTDAECTPDKHAANSRETVKLLGEWMLGIAVTERNNRNRATECKSIYDQTNLKGQWNIPKEFADQTKCRNISQIW